MGSSKRRSDGGASARASARRAGAGVRGDCFLMEKEQLCVLGGGGGGGGHAAHAWKEQLEQPATAVGT